MKTILKITYLLLIIFTIFGCINQPKVPKTASQILGNSKYLAFSYGGYREKQRNIVPTVNELKEDMKLLAAMGVKLIRTYNTHQFPQAENILKAIRELKNQNPQFEMYLMLGTWIECENAWTSNPNHSSENMENNIAEIEKAVELTNNYPDIIKIIAVGNEAMVHWATSYYVQPKTILKWVNYLQKLKNTKALPTETWITSSDNFASWGGGDESYHTKDLIKLINAVDFISLHTYPFHDTHYNPAFWSFPTEEKELSTIKKTDAAIKRAVAYATFQYQKTVDYIESLGVKKPIHIGETGWATKSSSLYGNSGSKAADEYKATLYYDAIREWTNGAGISCFYFEAFDEQWKDSQDSLGSENHFGLINLKGQAKYALWDLVDNGAFEGLTRNGKPITKTYNGDKTKIISEVSSPPSK